MKRPQLFDDAETRAGETGRTGARAASTPPGFRQQRSTRQQRATRQQRSTLPQIPGPSDSGVDDAQHQLSDRGPAETSAQIAAREAREARRRLREARRERRAYERREVRRFTQHSRRRRTTWIIALTAVTGLVVFVLVGAFSPLMALTTIEVRGASRVKADDIVDSLSDQLGRPLTLVDQGAIEKQLARFPLIRSYSTQSSPPNTLIVNIVERTPIALVHSQKGFDLVDSAGVKIETSAKRAKGYPLIVTAAGAGDAGAGAGAAPEAPGDAAQAADPGFAAAMSVLLALPDSLKGSVDTVTARTKDDVTLTLADGGPRVVWGSSENAEVKALVLSRLLESTNPKKVQEYDVSSPNAAVVR